MNTNGNIYDKIKEADKATKCVFVGPNPNDLRKEKMIKSGTISANFLANYNKGEENG